MNKLDLGGEKDKGNTPLGYVNVNKEEVFADIITDLDISPYPFEDNSIDRIYTCHTLEHIKDWIRFVGECHRILKPYCELEIRVPYGHTQLNNPHHLHDFTDKKFRKFVRLFGGWEIVSLSVGRGRFRKWRKCEITCVLKKLPLTFTPEGD